MPPKPTAANPLILATPTGSANGKNSANTGTTVQHDYSGLRPGSQVTSKDLQDYTHPTRPATVGATRLHAFGYDYFQPARDTVNALRAYYQGKSIKPAGAKSAPDTSQNHDVGSIDLNSPSITTGAGGATIPTPSTTGGAAQTGGADAGGTTAQSALAGGSILGAQGISPVTGPQSLLSVSSQTITPHGRERTTR